MLDRLHKAGTLRRGGISNGTASPPFAKKSKHRMFHVITGQPIPTPLDTRQPGERPQPSSGAAFQACSSERLKIGGRRMRANSTRKRI